MSVQPPISGYSVKQMHRFHMLYMEETPLTFLFIPKNCQRSDPVRQSCLAVVTTAK